MSKVKIVFIAILSAALILVFIYSYSTLNNFRLFTVNLFTFPLKAAQFISHSTKDYIEHRLYNKWIKENIVLKDKLNKFSHDIIRFNELEMENKRLTVLFNFKSQLPNKVVPARVIGVNSALFSKTMLIDKGKKDGIEVGMAVISIQGVVGKAIETNSNISRIMLLEDPDFRLGVIIQRTRERGLFVGGPAGMAQVIYLAPDSDVAKGDAIVSYPNNRLFPKGLLLGYIKEVKIEEIFLYKYASVQLAVSSSRVEEVLCIK